MQNAGFTNVFRRDIYFEYAINTLGTHRANVSVGSNCTVVLTFNVVPLF